MNLTFAFNYEIFEISLNYMQACIRMGCCLAEFHKSRLNEMLCFEKISMPNAWYGSHAYAKFSAISNDAPGLISHGMETQLISTKYAMHVI